MTKSKLREHEVIPFLVTRYDGTGVKMDQRQ